MSDKPLLDLITILSNPGLAAILVRTIEQGDPQNDASLEDGIRQKSLYQLFIDEEERVFGADEINDLIGDGEDKLNIYDYTGIDQEALKYLQFYAQERDDLIWSELWYILTAILQEMIILLASSSVGLQKSPSPLVDECRVNLNATADLLSHISDKIDAEGRVIVSRDEVDLDRLAVLVHQAQVVRSAIATCEGHVLP